jgi:hypothetical protein
VRSYLNASIQKSTVTVTAANLATTATVNGTAYSYASQVVTVTSANAATVATVNGTAYTANEAAGTKTKTEISTELAALINAGETLATAAVVGETCVVTSVSTVITVVGTTNCTVAHATATTTTIAAGLVARINAGESDITASNNAAVITIVGDTVEAGYTVVGTTNCTVTRITDAPGAISFGTCVVVDPDNNKNCKKPSVAADITGSRAIGFVKASQSVVTDTGYSTGMAVAVVKKGNIWVIAEEAVVPGDTVYVRHTANGTGKTEIGAVRNDTDSSTCSALAGAEVLDYDSTTGLAMIAINRP